MQPHLQPTITTPRVFNYSLDWRFLLPMDDLERGRFLFDDVEFSQTLEHVGIHDSQQISISEIEDLKKDSFPFFAMPFGLPMGRGARRNDRVKFYVSLRKGIDSNGYLLVGFNNVLNGRTYPQTKYHSSTPRRVADELMQAGFRSVKIYGAMPNLAIPEYIFELESRVIQFALQNRFRRKPAVLKPMRVLAGAIGWKRLSQFLPCYFALAAT